jgi:hypothetical protein
MKIHELDLSNKNDLKRWDLFVDDTAEGTIFHKSYWLLAHGGVMLFRANQVRLLVITGDDNKWIAGLPITYRRLFGKNLILMPYLTPYLGPIFSLGYIQKYCRIVSRKKEILTLFAETIKKFGFMVFYDFTPQVIDMQPFLWDGFQTKVNYTYILDISDLNKVDRNMDHRIRNNIRQAVKSGYEIMWGFEDNFNTFIDLNKMTFRRQNVKRYDHDITQKLLMAAYSSKACDIGVVVDADREPLASVAIVWDTKRVYSICGGISHKSHSAMSFLIWETFTYAGEVLNITEFDFEGSAIPSIEHYFRKFGGDIVPYYSLLSRTSVTVKWIKEMFG